MTGVQTCALPIFNEREEIKKELSNWSDIIQISVNGGCIAGLKKDGSCLICEIW